MPNSCELCGEPAVFNTYSGNVSLCAEHAFEWQQWFLDPARDEEMLGSNPGVTAGPDEHMMFGRWLAMKQDHGKPVQQSEEAA